MRSLSIVLVLTLCVAANAAVTWYTCQASSAQAGTTSTAYGAGNCQLDDVANTLMCNVSWAGLQGTVVPAPGGMHLHGPADQGTDAGVKWGFTGYSTAATGTHYQMFTALTTQDKTDFAASKFYLNIHTTVSAGGEIRCQMYPNTNRYVSDMTPGGITAGGGGPLVGNPMGFGRGWVTYAPLTGMATVRAYWFGMTGPVTSAHIHGPARANGQANVLVPFTMDAGATAEFSAATATQVLTADQYLDLASGNHYMVGHTTMNAGGEVRGQLFMSTSQNNIPAGTYSTGCTARSTGSEMACMSVDNVGRITWNGASYTSADCNIGNTYNARRVNYTLANWGVNQVRQRPDAMLDMTVARPWGVMYATTSNDDISTNSPCSGCSGYNGNRWGRTTVMFPNCPRTCPLMYELYANMFIGAGGNPLRFTQFTRPEATAFAMTANYYTFTASGACRDFIADVPLSGGASIITPSIMAIAAAALIALFRF